MVKRVREAKRGHKVTQENRVPQVRKERMDFQEERENLDLKETKAMKEDSVPFVAMGPKVTKAMMAKTAEMVFQESQVHREE